MINNYNKLRFFIFDISKVNLIFRKLKISKRFIAFILIPYYLLTVINALIEGLCMFLLAGIFTSGALLNAASLPKYVLDIVNILGGKVGFPDMLPMLIFLFGINIAVRFTLLSLVELIGVKLRKKLQEGIFKNFLMGQWSLMRNFRIGDAVGTNTQEATLVAKYIQSSAIVVYYIISMAVTFSMVVAASLKFSLILIFITLPIIYFVQKIIFVQTKLSKRSALLRNQFSADIIDRFNGLLQVHVDNNYTYHIKHGIKSQSSLAYIDFLIGLCQAGIGSFNLLIPFVGLIFLLISIYFFKFNYVINFSLLAGIGFLGLKILSNLNNLVGIFGTLSRLSGSLEPVLKALKLRPILKRTHIREKIKSIYLHNVSYSYGKIKVINGIDLKITKGSPLIIHGRSGKGKTTLLNLIAGLYMPDKGSIVYESTSNKKYLSSKYSANVGFVTQDIYLFEGSIRANLLAGRNFKDDAIWKVLDKIDAADFIKNIGGLDVNSSEAGRSFSGGQKRRLGIARVLLSNSNILIFDEVTAGLDKANKIAITKLIKYLSKSCLVIIISHIPFEIPRQRSFYL